ncbi:MAG: hypothetical protein ACOCRK_11585 [bacterium]
MMELGNCIGYLFIAWILSAFNFDEIFIKGIEELFNKKVTINSYYLIAFTIGLIIDLILIYKQIGEI